MAKIKEDCFAYSCKYQRCEALKATYCAADENCAFYKTKEQVETERKKEGKKR